VEFDVTFAGQKYGNRPLHIRSLIDAGIDVRVWGPHWQDSPRYLSLWKRVGKRAKQWLLNRETRPVDVPRDRVGPPLTDEEYVKLYSRSKISLGFSGVAELPSRGEPIKQVRLRDFEALMSGAFYMVEYFEELAEFFEPGKEIVCFTGSDDLVEKARYYLAHEDERDRIRQAGMQRARSEHTWHKRFEMVFRHIGLS
jgi:hypothetical protein